MMNIPNCSAYFSMKKHMHQRTGESFPSNEDSVGDYQDNTGNFSSVLSCFLVQYYFGMVGLFQEQFKNV